MTFRLVGSWADLLAFLRANNQTNNTAVVMPKMTEIEVENIEFKANTIWPKYYVRNRMYFKMIDSKRLLCVSLKSGLFGVFDRTRTCKSFLFELWRTDKLETRGYREISEMQYHDAYTEVIDNNNLLHRQNTLQSIKKA